MKLKVENNSTKLINSAIIMILSTKTKAEANVLLKPYEIKIVSSTTKDDTKTIILTDL